MTGAEKILVTREGWEELTDELRRCRQELDSKLSGYKDAIRGAEPGDAAVRHEQQEIAAAKSRMAYLEDILARAVPVGSADRTPGIVGIGSLVTIRWEDGEEETFLLVGPPEVDLPTNRISYESPVGRSLLGKVQHDEIEATTPMGPSRMKVVAVC